MSTIIKKSCLLLLLLSPLALQGQTMMLSNHHSDYVVVVPQSPDSVVNHAAERLACYWKLSTDCNLTVVTENGYTGGPAIFLGPTQKAKAAQLPMDSLRYDGFLLRTIDKDIYICSLQPKGVLYGIYYFLEHCLGMRMYAPDAVTIGHPKQLLLPKLDVVENPDFAFRDELYYYPNRSQEYADFHRLHNNRDLNRDWGMFVHTFARLVPPDRYFDQHPEWFSETEGRRQRDGQLCLSNPEVLEVLCHNLDSMMRINPEAKIWSVSNNDNYNVCTCPKCRHQDSLYGGPSGTLIHFVNQVAERFPDKTISTLGYQFTRRAPQSDIRPRENVNVMFCSIECGREQPLATSPKEADFRKDMQQWAAKTDNIFMWDYVIQFRNMMSPFPNLHVLQPNLKFFHDNGVRLMFEQGCANSPTAWMELRTYLLAKLMWNVDADVDSLKKDFFDGYYGAAGRVLMNMYDEMEQGLVASGIRLDIYGSPLDGRESYLSSRQLVKYQREMAEAYRLAEGDSALTARIRYWELPLDYAILSLGSDAVATIDGKNYHERAVQFKEDCVRFGVTMIMEMGVPPSVYLSKIENYLSKLPEGNKAYRCKARLAQEPDAPYRCGGAQGLTDGVAGQLDYRRDWLGFFGKPMDAVIDLGHRQPVHEVRADFFVYPLSWIFPPDQVDLYLSDDGENWDYVTSLAVAELPGQKQLAVPDIAEGYDFEDIGRTARYIRIVATPIKEIPDWHRAAGHPAWIFCDEVVVR